MIVCMYIICRTCVNAMDHDGTLNNNRKLQRYKLYMFTYICNGQLFWYNDFFFNTWFLPIFQKGGRKGFLHEFMSPSPQGLRKKASRMGKRFEKISIELPQWLRLRGFTLNLAWYTGGECLELKICKSWNLYKNDWQWRGASHWSLQMYNLPPTPPHPLHRNNTYYIHISRICRYRISLL